ncbi:MAG: glycosyltransferase, partial [Acidimicrobiales bacterium]
MGASVPLVPSNALLRSGSLMGVDPAAPPVVAVVVACQPGRWFEQTLQSLAGQDYPRLSVLVASVGEDGSTAERVAAVLPDAHLASFDQGTGFAQAANGALGMVDGVAHVLLCHDDVVLAPDAVRLLLEEAYRSNAGLVCPKCVFWDAADRLLSVGMGADRLGAAYQLVEPGELDQGQHDAARPVFLAPSCAVLVRLDLWRALGGFEPGIGEPGEDLEMSWRAQLAGARVVVAPQAVARHLEATLNGLRQGTATDASQAGRLRARREQHRLRTLWTCYSAPSLVLVAPIAVAFLLARSAWALMCRRGPGAAAWPV